MLNDIFCATMNCSLIRWEFSSWTDIVLHSLKEWAGMWCSFFRDFVILSPRPMCTIQSSTIVAIGVFFISVLIKVFDVLRSLLRLLMDLGFVLIRSVFICVFFVTFPYSLCWVLLDLFLRSNILLKLFTPYYLNHNSLNIRVY